MGAAVAEEGVVADPAVGADLFMVAGSGQLQVVIPVAGGADGSGVSALAFGWTCRVMLCGNAFP